MLDDKGNIVVYFFYVYICIRLIMCIVNIDCESLMLCLVNIEIFLEYLKEWKLGKCIVCLLEIFLCVLDDFMMYILCEFMYEMVIMLIEFYDNCYCVEKDCKIGEVVKVNMGWMFLFEVIVWVMEMVFYILGIKFLMKMWRYVEKLYLIYFILGGIKFLLMIIWNSDVFYMKWEFLIFYCG